MANWLPAWILAGWTFIIPAGLAAQKTTMAPSPEKLSEDLLLLVNRERAAVGLRILSADHDLQGIAAAHSEKMAQEKTLSHVFSGWLKPAQKLVAAGRFFSACGENVADSNLPLVLPIHDALMKSMMHRIEILDPRWTHAGIAFAQNGHRWYVTQEFAAFIEPQSPDRVCARLQADLGSLYFVKFQRQLPWFAAAGERAALIAHQFLSGISGTFTEALWGKCTVINYIHSDVNLLRQKLWGEMQKGGFSAAAIGGYWGRGLEYPGGCYSVVVILFSELPVTLKNDGFHAAAR